MSAPIERRAAGSSDDLRIQKSLSYCWKEGVAAQVMIGIVDYYLIPFALLLGASNPEIGILVAVPNLLSSISQFFAVQAVRFAGNRLRLILYGVFVQALTLLPLGLLAYANVSKRILFLTLAITLFKTIGSLIGPAWGSLVSEYLPANRRGAYFGWRSRVVGSAGLVNLCFWGAFLYYWKRADSAAGAFLLLFIAAGVARLVSLYLMAKMEDLPFHPTRESEFTFWMFVRRFRESNFVKFVLFVAALTFATNLAAPYFSVHMLKNLHFNYLNYMTVHLASVVTSLIAFPVWGRHADHVGNARILKTTSFFIPIIPLLWLLPRSPLPLFFVEMFSGLVWGGFNLCATNFIFDAVTPSKRVRCLGYFNLINGVAVFLGASIGGYLSTRLPPVFGMPLLTLFILSSGARLLAHFFLSATFTEVRADARPASSLDLFFSVVGIRPMFGRNGEVYGLIPKAYAKFGKRQ